ncbi:envoplakin [Periophthalmus magnuspinnatus]|uniref:envoplakin n=1 Tax=Periophthalmus magnuspinnatus TaxID=409849 RepID=UPI00145B7094|nr:envoplakin [Periophthalmus magnuspinnatus]
MSKKPSPIKISTSDAAKLAEVISRMQKCADQVEKDILLSEDLLAKDQEREVKNLSFLHQNECADKLGEAEGLLKDLFMDVDKAKKLGHPQVKEIERDVKNLHERWANDCAVYRDVYDQVQDLELKQKIDWGPLLDSKLRQLENQEFGPSLSDLEKQMATHKIMHQEIEAYSNQLQPGPTLSQDKYNALKNKYDQLYSRSVQRRTHLSSLYEYMQSCSKELVYLSSQQDRILNRDWSDRMVDPAGVRTEYEKFKTNGLQAHEGEIGQLHEEGDRLIDSGHPAKEAVQACQSKIQSEWQRFLNLCLAQEEHLDNIRDYKKFQLDAETLSNSLHRLHSNLDPKLLKDKSNQEVVLAIEGDDPALQRNEQRLSALRDLSRTVVPLKQRWSTPSSRTPVVSLCNWVVPQGSVSRGQNLTLRSNTDPKNWEVQDDRGQVLAVPGACFMVPAPDQEVLSRVDSLQRELSELKERRAKLLSSLKTSTLEKVAPQKAVTISSVPDDPKAKELVKSLDQINAALERIHKEILRRLREPLDNRNPGQDLATRLQEHEKTALALNKLESEKAALQREMQPIITQKPLGPTTSTLPVKLSTINNRIDDISTLMDLYKKKASASLFLEKHMQKVDGIVSGFEEKLAKNGAIQNKPNALPACTQELQALKKDAASQKDELNKLGKELELTEQACNSLQQNFSEYCPDIRRQENRVKVLRNRFNNVNTQLSDRLALVQEATNKNQDFQNASQSLDFFLFNLPNNTVKPSDDAAQISAKQYSQMRVVEDIEKKSADLDRVKNLSRDLQNLLNTYEAKSSTYRDTLYGPEEDDDDENDEEEEVLSLNKRQPSTMAQAVQKKEKDLLNLYSEVSAKNNQLLKQLSTTKNIKARNEDMANHVVVIQQQQLQTQQKDLEASDSLKRELNEEISRRMRAESDLETYTKRFVSLKSRRGVERLEEKEVVQYYRDPKLEVELEALRRKIQDESTKRSRTHTEIEILNQRMTTLQLELSRIEPKLITKVLTEYERDPALDREAARMREEMERIRLQLQTQNSETIHVKTELSVLAQQKPKIREKVVKKEVVRLEKDPEMLKSVLTFQNDLADEESRCQILHDNIFSVRSEINILERVIPTIEPKIVTKVVKKVDQDPNMLEEVKKLRICLEEEKDENVILMKDLTTLQLRYGEIEKIMPKVEINEIINELYRVDPETEVELVRLRKELQELNRNRSEIDKEIISITSTLSTLRAQKPKVEYKEVTQEVIKQEKSPEVQRELQRLTHQVARLQSNVDSTMELLIRLRKERDQLKEERSTVETKLVTKELIKYEDDPLLLKEADRMRRNLREEIHQRRTLEESLFDLQNIYITLERQRPEEKIITQEVVRLQKDPKQIQEYEKLNRTVDEEVKARRKLEQEVRQLRALLQEKESMLTQMDDRQKKIQVEAELRQIKARILELETTTPPVEEKIIIEEVLKVERDPNLEKLTGGIRLELETEGNEISRLEREIRNIRIRLEMLQKEKSMEKVVYREVVRVEKDPTVEAERDLLRDKVSQEKNKRRDVEDALQSLTLKITQLMSSKTVVSQEETILITNKEALQREKEDLLRQFRALEAQRHSINVTFQQQSKLVSERTLMARQRSLKTTTEIQRLEKEILNEKDKIHQKETMIIELQNNIQKEDQAETHTRETNMSTRVSILDPETGKDLSPYDAYLQGLLSREQYIHLAELECDWEEITSTGPEGDSSIIQDRKSGKQYSVKDALMVGRLSEYDLNRYRDGKMSISEFALLVAGETRVLPMPPLPPPSPGLRSPTKLQPSSPLPLTSTSRLSSYGSLNNLSGSLNSLSSSFNNLSNFGSSNHLSSSTQNLSTSTAGDEFFPISGIYDNTTDSRMSVRSALTRKIIDADTALKLLEAQAASGGIVDLMKKDKLSVHKAAQQGLIDQSQMYKLLNAQKAFTGVEDPVTKERLAVGPATQKGYIPEENARRYIEAQYLTGGLVDPAKAGRLSLADALDAKLIDENMAKNLRDESQHTKELLDPITKEKISYKQAMERCKKDVTTGLLLLPAVSTEGNAPSYSTFKFASATRVITS